jgi:ATP phosphoribosyltransferase regulatory subunit
LGPDEAAKLLRFVDPQNGDVLALRSDITPQIARLMAGPMKDAELPIRLCYFGRVFRLRQHREFQRRELAQAGVELLGLSGPEADAEVLRVCADALTAAGVNERCFSIGHVGVLHAALEDLEVTEDEAHSLRELLRKKDPAGIRGLGAKINIDPDRIDLLANLCTLYGNADSVLEKASKLAAMPPGMDDAIQRIHAILTALGDHPCRAQALVDLGEMLGFGYYTGFVFHGYVPGYGQAIASGGRYDSLIAKYGRDIPAAGFAIDEEGLTEVGHRER